MSDEKAFSYVSQVHKALGEMNATKMHAICSFADHIREGWLNKGRVWIVGNGGSAATASHLANDLVKMCGIDAISIPDLTPIIMAYGNDDEWENMFSHYLDSVGKKEDILIAISCSGRSANVIRATEVAYRKGMLVLALTGKDRDENLLINPSIKGYVPDVFISVDHSDIRVVEDIHLVLCHSIAGELRD